MSEWDFGNKSWKDSNPLGEHSENMIWDMPQWGIYLRRDERYQCPNHYDPSAKSAVQTVDYCPFCLGLGIKTSPMIVPTRVNLAQAKLSIRQSDVRLDPGFAEYFVTSIDLPRSVKVKLEDIILYCDWDKPFQEIIKTPRGRPLRIQSMYLVKSINDHYEREMGWYDCGVEGFDYREGWAEKLLPHFVNLPVLTREQWQHKSFW